jgi:hypothetical protein
LEQFDNPAAGPVFKEWLSGVPQDVLENLAGLMHTRCVAAAARRAGQPVGEFLEQGIGEMIRQMEPRASDSVTLVLTKPDGREWARVEFPAAMFELVETGARQLGITVPEFVELAGREKIERDAPRQVSRKIFTRCRQASAGAGAGGKGGAR